MSQPTVVHRPQVPRDPYAGTERSPKVLEPEAMSVTVKSFVADDPVGFGDPSNIPGLKRCTHTSTLYWLINERFAGVGESA
jgi:hypothetical protein